MLLTLLLPGSAALEMDQLEGAELEGEISGLERGRFICLISPWFGALFCSTAIAHFTQFLPLFVMVEILL